MGRSILSHEEPGTDSLPIDFEAATTRAVTPRETCGKVKANHPGLSEGERLFAGMGSRRNDDEELQFAILSESGTPFIGLKRKAYGELAAQLTPVMPAHPLAVGHRHPINRACATDLVARFLPDA